MQSVDPETLQSPHLRALVSWYEAARAAQPQSGQPQNDRPQNDRPRSSQPQSALPQSALPGGWPPRDAFRPETLAPATLPHVGLVEIEPEPFRVLYRVLGEVLTASRGGHLVRLRYLDDLDWPQRDELTTIWREVYAQGTPRFMRGNRTVNGMAIAFESCALPIGSPDEPTRRYVVGEDYLDSEAWHAAVRQRR